MRDNLTGKVDMMKIYETAETRYKVDLSKINTNGLENFLYKG
jgi:hypothetical protein